MYCATDMILHFTAFYYFFTASYFNFFYRTIFYNKLPHFYCKLPPSADKKFQKKFTKNYNNLLQWYCNLQQQFTAFNFTASVFSVVSTSKYWLYITSILLQLTTFYCNFLFYYFLLQFYCKLPNFTDQKWYSTRRLHHPLTPKREYLGSKSLGGRLLGGGFVWSSSVKIKLMFSFSWCTFTPSHDTH